MTPPDGIELVCKEVVELVTEYLGHTLPARAMAQFEEHLLTCPPCTAYLAQMRVTLELAGELGAAAPPVVVEQQLLSLFRRWQSR